MNLATKSQYFTIDVITDIDTSTSFEDLVLNADKYYYLQSTANMSDAMCMVAAVPWAGKLMQHPLIGSLLTPDGPEEDGIGRVIG